MTAGDAVGAGLALIGVAVGQGVLEFIEQTGIEHGEFAVFEPGGALAGLEETLDFRGGKAVAAGGGEFVLQVEPVLAGGADFEAGLDALDVAGDMGKAAADGDRPRLFEPRQIAGEEGEDRGFAFQNELGGAVGAGEAGRVEAVECLAFGGKMAGRFRASRGVGLDGEAVFTVEGVEAGGEVVERAFEGESEAGRIDLGWSGGGWRGFGGQRVKRGAVKQPGR